MESRRVQYCAFFVGDLSNVLPFVYVSYAVWLFQCGRGQSAQKMTSVESSDTNDGCYWNGLSQTTAVSSVAAASLQAASGRQEVEGVASAKVSSLRKGAVVINTPTGKLVFILHEIRY